jgi:hypothetical protein
MKKYKQLIIGIIIGVMVASVVPVGAAIEEYILKKSPHKLAVNGEYWPEGTLPMMIYQDGYNYIPAATFRGICENMNIPFAWDREKEEIQIGETKKSIDDTSFKIYQVGEKCLLSGVTITLKKSWAYPYTFSVKDTSGLYIEKQGKVIMYNFEIATDENTFLSNLGQFYYDISNPKYAESANIILEKPRGNVDFGSLWCQTTKLDIKDDYDINYIIYSNPELKAYNIKFKIDY